MSEFKDSLPLQLIKARDVALDYFRPVLADYELTVQQWRVMRVIHAYTEIDFTNLSKECCILSPSLTGIITRLEKQGFVCKIKSAEDQRRVNLRLTSKANTLVEEMKVEIDKQYTKLKQEYGVEKFNQLAALLGDLINMRNEQS